MDNNYKILLNEYKKYDYLNKNTPLVKILVSYIKPAFLFKSEILTPIHLGRVVAKDYSKDGIITDEDLKWLMNKCIGDDDVEGSISHTNRRVGFLTGTYWAWKNYKKLGNPQYFGSFGYRKLLDCNILSKLNKYDLILPNAKQLNVKTNKAIFCDFHCKSLFDSLYSNFKKIHPELLDNFDEYLVCDEGYYDEIYIMKKDLFFEFCEWIFPLLDACLKDPNCKKVRSDETAMSVQNFMYLNDLRDVAFAMEMYTGFYLYWKQNQVNIKSTTCKIIGLEDTQEKQMYAKSFINFVRNKIK